MVDGVERSLLALGAEARAEVRLDASPGLGILHATIEHDATSLVIGWKGWSSSRHSYFGESVNALIAEAPVPLLLVRAGESGSWNRVVLVVDPGDLRHQHVAGVMLGGAIAARLAAAAGAPIEVCVPTSIDPADFGLDSRAVQHLARSTADQVDLLRRRTQPGDLVVKGLPTTGLGVGSRLVRISRALEGRTVVAVVPPRTRMDEAAPLGPASAVRIEPE